MKSFLLFFLFLFFLNNQSSFAQAGAIDSTFNPADVGYAGQYGADRSVHTTVIQKDSGIIIGGEFYNYDGVSRNCIARLKQDGLLDVSFNPGTGFSGTHSDEIFTTVYAIAIQPDGKIIVGGNFTDYNGTPRSNIARLNSDGSLDAGFNPGTGISGEYAIVYAIALQTDGKIIVGGYFSDYNGTSTNDIIRLNSDGSLDASFNTGTGTGSAYTTVYAIALQMDRKIIVGGQFTDYNGTSKNNIARLNSDGSLDAAFNTGSGADGDVRSMIIQPNGKIVIAGRFYDYNDVERNKIARLNADGSLDNSFDAGNVAGDNNLNAVVLQNDGSIIAGGGLSSYWYGPVQDVLFRVNSNGTKDPNFYPPWLAAPTFSVPTPGNTYCLAIQSNGQILVGGSFGDRITSEADLNIHRLNYDGTPDAGFDVSTGANGYVGSIVIQPDKKILISGGFTSFNGVHENQVARLNVNGTPDPGFRVNDTLYVSDIALQNDGKVMASTYYYGVKRLNTNGRIDSVFPHAVQWGEAYKIAIQTDGKILVGGSGLGASPPLSSLLRLNANGTMDQGFNSTVTQNSTSILAGDIIAIQPDNKIVTGDADWQQTSTPYGILRLNNDGSRDQSFLRGTGADGYIWEVAIENDGKILVGGSFRVFSGNNINFLARLNADGSLDKSFNSGSGPDSSVFAIAIQNDGKILIGGDFTTYNGISRNKIARLNSDATLDSTFKPGSGANGSIKAIAIQSDGKILIGGDFTAYNGIGRNRVARLLGIGNTAAYVSIAISSGSNCPGQPVTFTASPTNGGSSPTYQWKVNGNNVGTNSPTYTTNTLTSGQVVSCMMTSNLATANPSIAASNLITVKTPVVPVASVTTSASNPSCGGESLIFRATLTNDGVSPTYQWKVNGNNVGTNSPTFATNTLTNGQVVTCVITAYTLACANQVTVTSNPITTKINSCTPSALPPSWAWAKKSAGVKDDDYSWSMTKDKNENLFVIGRFNGDSIQFGNIILRAPGGGIFVVKYDASGNVIWGRTDAGNANSDAISIATDQGGNVFVAGTFYGSSITFGNITLTRTPNGFFDTYIVKFDSTGNTIWAKSATGDEWSTPYSLAADNAGNIYMAGEFWSTSMNFSGTILDNANPWNYVDMFLVKYNSAGNVVWAKRAESYSFATYTNGVAVDNTGNIYVTGSFKGDYNYRDSLKFGNFTLYNHSGGDAPNYFIVKYDPSGNVLWAVGADKFLGRSSGNGISIDKWGNVYVVGDFSYNDISFGNSLVAYQGNQDIFITKYDPSGNVKWAKGLGSAGYEYSGTITADNDGNVYIGGFFANDNINIGGVVYNNTGPAGTSDILVVKCDSAGNFLWTKTAGGNDGDGVAGIVTDANKNIYITGSFYSSQMTFGCTTLLNSDSTAKTSDFYIAKLGVTDTNLIPKLSITLTSGTNSICQGQPVTFTATPTNGGANPIYQWKVNGNNVGTNSSTYTTNTLTNGQVVTCLMTLTSTSACANAVQVISNPLTVNCGATGVVSPANLNLQVHPNPANQNAMITFYLGASVRISLDAVNMLGQQIKIFENGVLNSGSQTIPWNTEKLAAGVYFIRLRTVNYSIAKKVTVIH
jgi:uncharacterized delta-60 repeat protein